MEVIHGLENYSFISDHTIVAIGNFDGVHLGHQKILLYLEKKAKEFELFSLVLTFFPHPGQILGKNGIKMIQTLDQRIREINKFDIHAVLIIPFDERFASLSGQDFIRKIVLNRLKAKAVIVGENFYFGKNREGDTALLHRLSSKYNFRICPVPSVIKERKTVSSSLIRNFLQEGKVEEVSGLLGRSYEIEGKVIEGQSRGKSLGFPTANIETENEIIPQGVFITQTRIGTEFLPSMTNVGSQPTFNQRGLNIESYILNFEGNLYGEQIGIHFLKKIRDEVKFRTPDDLARQLEKDLEATQAHFRAKSKILD
ncbi:MAG: bifunctional riboflavin kinase/FAD synthetase [Candidatus Aminicenantes bacterium]|nr:MAG: bifunctional riboflavin kinase/FAD synthetase [Candidatus Aminicenantes bacterium]